MALSLNDLQKQTTKSASRRAKKPPRSNEERTRPWQRPDLEFSEESKTPPMSDSTASLWHDEEEKPFSPSSTTLKMLIQVATRAQQKSYYISQLTYAGSWWSRLKLHPRIKIPLPRSWVVRDQ